MASSNERCAEIDEDVWALLYRIESWLFSKPSSDKISVELINHFGDETLQEYGAQLELSTHSDCWDPVFTF